MNLSDMVDFVCTKVNQTEDEDKAICRDFLERRYEMIWNDQTWKDSLIEYTQTVTSTGYNVQTSTWLPTAQVLLLPKAFALPLAARLDSGKMDVVSPEVFYRVDFDAFNGKGRTTQFRLLSPCVWQWDSTRSIQISSTAASINAIVDVLSSDLVTVTRTSYALQGLSATFSTTRIDSVTKDLTGNLRIAEATTGTVVSVASGDSEAPKRQRIQFFGTMPENAVIRVLGKSAVPTFTEDNDKPAISGVENCLLAFAQADMLQRERQYQKADLIAQEGNALLEQLKRTQVVQQAHNKQIIPDDGYGGQDSYPFYNAPPLSF